MGKAYLDILELENLHVIKNVRALWSVRTMILIPRMYLLNFISAHIRTRSSLVKKFISASLRVRLAHVIMRSLNCTQSKSPGIRKEKIRTRQIRKYHYHRFTEQSSNILKGRVLAWIWVQRDFSKADRHIRNAPIEVTKRRFCASFRL